MVSVSVSVICLTVIAVSFAGPCKILKVSSTAAQGKLIRVGCGGKTVIVSLLEVGSHSTLKVIDGHDRHLLTVDYFKDTKDMFIVIQGERFDVKDEKTKGEEAAKFRQLLADPELEFFPAAVRLIHDELQLKGWESPAAMFLYRIGIAAQDYRIEMNKRGAVSVSLEKRGTVDPSIYHYHGPHPTKKCKYNGWSDPSMDNFIAHKCRGLCGPACTTCWKWVCGDCCMHTGCYRHDVYCDGPKGFLTSDCLTARGVLWDNITKTPMGC